jgi:anti-sigma regulatory factor (Ser/Thr protein kinase)
VELEIPPRHDHLALVRLVVESTARLGGKIPDRRIDDLRLAVSEGCSNALDAQRAVDCQLPVRVTIELSDEQVAVTLTDHAGGFDPHDVDPIPAATDPQRLRHERGLGIPLMRSLMDEVVFTRTADGTALRLVTRS